MSLLLAIHGLVELIHISILMNLLLLLLKIILTVIFFDDVSVFDKIIVFLPTNRTLLLILVLVLYDGLIIGCGGIDF
jgi:hypothetical protein